ncbi:SdpI family protein [Hymenobacter negativus]|uniref:SdpI family protein n=1 Tax=Hymenobacter negativus TaxID=2795026 RepID=A0ABS3QKS4_9BACT|nr:SdpI family protein [Hymenobacter negativus]MBO2011869.1 SdpI family protein [Hymenobacter negativus]
MKKNLLPWHLLTLVVVLAPSLYLAYLWPQLPAQVPTHFAADGQANGYTARANMWLLTLGVPLAMALFFGILPRLDPKRRLDGNSVNFQKLRLAVVLMLSGLPCYSLYVAVHPASSGGRGLTVLVGLFFAYLGNYLTTVQPNYFVGIRTPWTLENPVVWGRTHRVGGIVFCISGLVIAGLGLIVPPAHIQLIIITLIMLTAAFCYAYSYAVFQQEERLRNMA